MKQMKKRAILLVISLAAFLIIVATISYAWYTKMVAVTAVEFNAAQWEFNANTQLDTIYVNVFRYYQVNPGTGAEEFGKLAAPGTQGFIPVDLSAESSDTDVYYELIINKTSMSQEFQERIHFYQDPECTREMLSNEESTALSGSIPYGTQETVRVYWKWIYEMKDLYPSASPEEQMAWDDFDTKVGKNPSLYEDQMNVKLLIRATQILPGGSREASGELSSSGWPETSPYGTTAYYDPTATAGPTAWWEERLPSGASARDREIYQILAESCTDAPDYCELLNELGMEYDWGWYDPMNGWLVCADGRVYHEYCRFDGHAFILEYPMRENIKDKLSSWLFYPTFYDWFQRIYFYPIENIRVVSMPYPGRWLPGTEDSNCWYNVDTAEIYSSNGSCPYRNYNDRVQNWFDDGGLSVDGHYEWDLPTIGWDEQYDPTAGWTETPSSTY